MPSIYLRRAVMPDSYQVIMPFGTFTVGRTQCEGENESGASGSVEFLYCNQRITRSQYRMILVERDRLSNIDSVRVRAANAARDEAIDARAERSAQAEQERPLKLRRKLEDKIAWADGELARINTIKLRAQRDLEELQS